MKNITHLVFSGNALKSLFLCGVLRYLYCYNLDKQIHDVSGTSMGAFFALAFALKIPIEKLENIIYETAKNDKVTIFKPTDLINIIEDYGVCCSIEYLEEIRNYVREIYQQDDLTFLELSKKTGTNIYISTTRLDNGDNVIFNVNDTPNVSVFEAIAASMCIPLVSAPILIGDYYYLDGYFTNNLPYEIFTNNNISKSNILAVACNMEECSFLKLSKIDKNNRSNIFEYIRNVFILIKLNTYNLCYLNKIKDFKDVLYIKPTKDKYVFDFDTKNNIIDCRLTEQELNNIFLSGYKEMHDYMNNYSIAQI